MEVFTEPRDYSWNFEIDLDPVCKNGWKTTSRGRQYKPKKVRDYETAAEILIRQQGPDEPLKGPLLVRMIFFLPRPSSHFTKSGKIKKGFPEYPTKQNSGDLDNLCKALADSMTAAGVWHDDSQAVDLHLFKRYCPQGVDPRIIISVEPIERQTLIK